MRTYNRAVVIGHAGNDPVLRSTKSGKSVLNLSIATNLRRKDGPEETTWHRVVFWDRLAEIVNSNVRKGSPLYVEGTMSMSSWTDKDGTERSRTEINARELLLLGSAPAGAQLTAPRARPPARPQADGEERGEVVEDIPF
jgi:single-strand DNA-binding protein